MSTETARLDRPSDVLFGPDSSLYIVDWGASPLAEQGLVLKPRTGVVWRVYRDSQQPMRPSGPIIVAAAALPIEQQQAEVPNVPETYRMTANTLALLIGGVVLVAVLLFLGVRRLRRG